MVHACELPYAGKLMHFRVFTLVSNNITATPQWDWVFKNVRGEDWCIDRIHHGENRGEIGFCFAEYETAFEFAMRFAQR